MAKKDDQKEVQTYSCEVRLGGDIMHTQILKGVTQREIVVLKAIHGDSGVAHIKEDGKKPVDDKEELYELAVKYSKSLNPKHGVKLIERTFNVILTGFAEWFNNRIEAQEAQREAALRKSQEDAAKFGRAREAAEAQVRANLAREAAGVTI